MTSQSQPLNAGSEPAPIAQLLPLAVGVGSGLYSVVRTLWGYTIAGIALLLAPFNLLVLPALAFLFAPITASVRLILQLVLAPYYAVVYVSQTILPFYVIIGSALFCGTLLGLCARQVVALIGVALLGRSGKEDRGRAAGRPVQPTPTMRNPSKGKKRASVKFEHGA
ncbi:hypothetical protein PENSPDRAFT_749938 [Peniophora sp. CONT]|nr:hypothetical protein PENSPDRAFT_749938 [Peniophora sp. CONT]